MNVQPPVHFGVSRRGFLSGLAAMVGAGVITTSQPVETKTTRFNQNGQPVGKPEVKTRTADLGDACAVGAGTGVVLGLTHGGLGLAKGAVSAVKGKKPTSSPSPVTQTRRRFLNNGKNALIAAAAGYLGTGTVASRPDPKAPVVQPGQPREPQVKTGIPQAGKVMIAVAAAGASWLLRDKKPKVEPPAPSTSV